MAVVGRPFKRVISFITSNFTNTVIPRSKKSYLLTRSFSLVTNVSVKSGGRNVLSASLAIAGVTVGAWTLKQFLLSDKSVVLASENNEQIKVPYEMSRRERRFHDFASCEYNGQIVMTPFDFLESLLENQPKMPKNAKIRLTDKNMQDLIRNTPKLSNGSQKLFRNLHHDGIITYSEYLFLVTILTKSTAGLKIALKMMDEDGDCNISLKEFQLIETMINKSASKITSSIPKDDEKRNLPHTTLLLHLFGKDGKQVVTFKRFFKFMDDLQDEVLELEVIDYAMKLHLTAMTELSNRHLLNPQSSANFTIQKYKKYLVIVEDKPNQLFAQGMHPFEPYQEIFKYFSEGKQKDYNANEIQKHSQLQDFHEYSKSLKKISEIDFAKILLRNTVLTEAEYCEFLERLKVTIKSPKGISMVQFKAFHRFLSNLDDFVMAVNMTNILHTPIDKDLFLRSVKVTIGHDIDPYVIDVVFSLFDQDGDGKLSQNEFIGIMKDRLKRGFGKFPNMLGVEGFKHCLRKEMAKQAD